MEHNYIEYLKDIFFIVIISVLDKKKIPVAPPLSHVKELPYGTPPLTFALLGCAPSGGEASTP